MKRNLIVKIVLALAILASTSYFSYRNYVTRYIDKENTSNIASNYNLSENIKYSLDSLSSEKKSQIITNIKTSSNILSLSFEDIDDRENIEEILKLLDEYDVKATFFVSGIKAAEDPEIIGEIKKHGHEIGSQTLGNHKYMENLSTEELATDFCKTNEIIGDITGNKPELLKCNSTIYNDKVLSTAYSSGNKYVVDSDHFINYQSFKNYDQVDGYIKRISNGTIISIKLSGVLDDSEYDNVKKDEKPAIDKDAGTTESNKEPNKEEDIVKTVEWILKSLNIQKIEIVQVGNLKNITTDNNTNLLNTKLLKQDNPITKSNNEPNILNKSNLLYVNNDQNDKTEDNSNKSQVTTENEINMLNYKELVEKNNGKLAPYVSKFYTTQRALTYTFRGLSNEATLDKVLECLNENNIKGTFFVTKEEILKYPDRIDKIIQSGNEVANGGVTNGSKLLDESPEDICKEIYEVDELLRKHGINTNAYMPGYGYVNEKVQEALSSINSLDGLKKYELFTYSKAPIISKYKNMSPEKIIDDYFNINSYTSLQKGEIVYFRLDSNLFEDNNTLPNLIRLLTNNYVKNGYIHKFEEDSKTYKLVQNPLNYSVVTLKNLQNTFELGSQLGRYKLQGDNINSLPKRTKEDALSIMYKNYIGNEDVNLADFSEEERSVMDKTGAIDTKGESTIFFTFDDWGGDVVVNEILDVLDKHKVKGSFFVISKNIDINSNISNSNPNLLRTIALKGHDIGSHTYNHDMLDTNKDELSISLDRSYSSMANIIGDLNSLKPYFRPPTLLVTKHGLESVFESGYEYAINGNISTHDYASGSSQEIVDYISDSLVKGDGNIVVMHMNNQAYFTPEALDIFLTNNEKGLYGEKYKIAKLSDYLDK